MNVRSGTKVHPASFDLIRKLKDYVGLTYEDIAKLCGVTPGRIQQIVLAERERYKNAYDSSSSSTEQV